MLPQIGLSSRRLRRSPWGFLIEQPEDTALRKALEMKMPRDSFHQIPRVIYPRCYSTWRVSTPDPFFIQSWTAEQPEPANLKKQCMYRKKLEKKKYKARKKISDFFLSKFLKLARSKRRETYIWNEHVKPERLKGLIQKLASSVELEQLYAAQALGCLGVAEESVISALCNTLQESSSLPLRYEAARSLALLGCLETPVVKMLVKHLKDARLNRQEDALAALKASFYAWAKLPEFQRCWIGARSSLMRNLHRLASLQYPINNIAFNAAMCLGYLDDSNPIAKEIMYMCLSEKDWKRRMQALVMLTQQMNLRDAVTIKSLLEQLQHSTECKHRADSAKLLTLIGLDAIQEEDLEEEVFKVLLEKLHAEPFLVVKQSVALAVEELKMKKRVWDIVEKQLKDENEEIRKQAVISLGVLGFRHKSIFFTMLEMLELDTSEKFEYRECTKALKMLDKVPLVQKDLMIQSFRLL